MEFDKVFFDDWIGIYKLAITAPIMYIAVILYIRLVGKRATSQMNNFDWVVTVALGSIMASGIILDNVTIIEALLAIAILLGAQWVLTKNIVYSPTLAKIVKAKPTLLVDNGEWIKDAMTCERVTKSEVMAALRQMVKKFSRKRAY